jgi:protease-4
MQPEMKRRPVQPRADGGLLLGTGLVLVLIFVVIIALFFILSSYNSSLVGKCVAVVNLDQEISVAGTAPGILGGDGSMGSDDIAATIDGLNQRDDVGAVLFVVNSPGGSVVATHEIYDAVKGLDKPKVAYFREVAASGAYYVATGTDYIVSDPDAITGSIGVIATFTDFADLLQKVGVNVTAIKSGPYKDIGSEFRNMTPEEADILQTMINETYNEFRNIVITNRGSRLNLAKFNAIADGRILSGRQAYAVGLVDQLGTKKDAILKAAQLANMTASSADDVRLCPISTTIPSQGLFGLDSIIRSLQERSDVPTLSYK